MQLGEQGVRQFELDLWYLDGAFHVHHVLLVDPGTTCELLADCLSTMAGWSAAHPLHHPLVVLLELKDPYWASRADGILEALDAEVLAGWPEGGVITPDEVRGDHATLRDALAADGWPSLRGLRGRVLFVLLSSGGYLERYTGGGGDQPGRPIFANARGDLSRDYASVHTIDDPISRRAHIEAAVRANHLVRTRADGVPVDDPADTARQEAALASGAQCVTTDYPAATERLDYVTRVPGGTPSRCNPLISPENCTSRDIEDPAQLR